MIFTMNRTVIIESGLPKPLWDKASQWSAYTKNRVPHKALNGKTPIEKLFPEKSAIHERRNLRPFGQKVVCFDYKAKGKLAPRSFEGRIIGYTNTYRVY
jgi:hypothetical protein